MPWKEWALILNSLLIQLALGLMVFTAIYRPASAGDGPGMWLAGALIATGMAVSLFHLGHPLRAYRAAANLKRSWLSREVVFTGLFLVVWLISLLFDNAALRWSAIVVGLLSVWSMANIYTATGIKGWCVPNTHVSFFGTVVILGSTGAAFLTLNAGLTGRGMTTAVLGALILTFLRLAWQRKLIRSMQAGAEDHRHLDHLVTADPVAQKRYAAALYQRLSCWSAGLTGAGAAMFFYLLVASRTEAVLPAAACMLVVLGELLGRAGFYSLWHQPEEIPQSHRDAYGRYLGA